MKKFLDDPAHVNFTDIGKPRIELSRQLCSR